MSTFKHFFNSLFGVIIRGQSYLNILYLLLAFPLGIFYFVFLITGFSLGLALLIIWIGLLILPLMFAGSWLLAMFERQLAIWLLNEKIPPMAQPLPPEKGTLDRIKAHLSNPVTWKSLVYLFARFPLGIFSFVVVVFCISLTGAFLTAPLTFSFFPLQVEFWGNLVWRVDTLGSALIAFLIGLVFGLASLHVMNALAWVYGKFALLMLGDPKLAPAASSRPVLINEPAESYVAEPEPVDSRPDAASMPVIYAHPEIPPQSETQPQEPEQAVPEDQPVVEQQIAGQPNAGQSNDGQQVAGQQVVEQLVALIEAEPPAGAQPAELIQTPSPEADSASGIEETAQPSL